ncbi:hypothetical protein [Microbulbifer halophilus]|uniref:FAD/NAD(P)-binding domain-containing protein n=1 Tax=Microbulbifer halophilus TaxID=453963 RepID=A0ABW5EE80_9GAMM|nr:hypothetical protein [Microbulbifer halophilus]MCW8128237.1 hypothetical protein [Microbulbifer halophilus]
MTKLRQFHSVVVGGGPAGIGPLVYGAWSGRIDELLKRGLALVEAGPSLGAGCLKRYAINSNSPGSTFLESLEHGIDGGRLHRASASPLRAEVGRFRESVLPLSLASELLDVIGTDVAAAISSSPESRLALNTRVDRVRILGPSRFELRLVPSDGSSAPEHIQSNHVLLAAGGEPHVPAELGESLMAACRRRGVRTLPMAVCSDELLTEAGRKSAEAWLDNFDSPQVIVVGGGHSALSSAWLLLERMAGDFLLGADAVQILHRSPVKVFYKTVAMAQEDGFSAFGADDIGSKGEVFPIGGLRGDAKELFRRIAGLAETIEPRACLRRLPSSAQEWDQLDMDWTNLALVVFATGYRFPRLQLCNALGAPVSLHGGFTGRYVDQDSRLLDACGEPIRGLFATGVASGFSPVEMLSGESSFKGKENSVWLCQHHLGEALFNTLVA